MRGLCGTFLRGASVTAALAVILSSSARAEAGVQPEENRIADILQSALVAHGAEVNRCFERALADTLDVAGKIELSVDVGAAGKITRAESALDEVKSPVLLACLEASALTWTLVGIDPGSTVVVPLAFEGQAAQFTIKVADAPDHGPPAPKHKAGGAAPPAPPFSVKLLVDEATMHAQKVAVAQLTVAPANRIALHRHPGAEILYVLRGHARVLGAAGVAPEKLDEGMAIYIPPSMPHAIENMGRQTAAVLLEVFVPPGPEKVFRDPKDPEGRAAFEVLHDPKVASPQGETPPKFVVSAPVAADAAPLFGGKGKATPLLDVAHTGNRAVYLGKLEAEPRVEVPRHSHAGTEEIIFVTAGAGELTVGSEKFPFEASEALYIPAGQPHSVKFTGTDKAEMVQIYAPAGPEDRYKDATKAKR